MKYLCLCYYDQQKLDALSPSDIEELREACEPHDEMLRNSSHVVAIASLAVPAESITIRPGEYAPSIELKPYSGTTEPLGAFFILEAESLDKATEVASRHPGAHVGAYLGGGIEIRPIDVFEVP